MSILQMCKVWEHEFSHSHQSVMLALADHAHDDGSGIRPSIDRISWKTGYARRNVQMMLKDLKDIGVLIVTREATSREPAQMAIDWTKAKPKTPFDEFKKSCKHNRGKASKNRGANFAPLNSEVIDRSSLDNSEAINRSSQGCNSDHPRDDLSIASGVINRSSDPSINHSLKPSIEPSDPPLPPKRGKGGEPASEVQITEHEQPQEGEQTKATMTGNNNGTIQTSGKSKGSEKAPHSAKKIAQKEKTSPLFDG